MWRYVPHFLTRTGELMVWPLIVKSIALWNDTKCKREARFRPLPLRSTPTVCFLSVTSYVEPSLMDIFAT
jgi:hypothetical protein